MVHTTFDAEREYDTDRFSTRPVFRNQRTKAVLGYFEPGQFVPVHVPGSDVVIAPPLGQRRRS